MSDVIQVNDSNFEKEVLQSTLPVLVDFGADWCGPCKRQIPIIEKFATENLTKVKVCQVDVDEAHAIASKFGIKSVPMIVLFRQGKKVDSKVGLTTLAGLNSLVIEKVGAWVKLWIFIRLLTIWNKDIA